MVFKVFRVMLRSFQEICTILSNGKTNTSSSEPKVRTRKQKFINLRQNSQSQMSSDNVRKQKIEIGKTQEQVLQILNSDINCKVKESSFSPYRPLPEIGDGSSIKSNKPKIMRQLTYNVLDPVFVKGPIDFNNFNSHIQSKNSRKEKHHSSRNIHHYKEIDNRRKKVNEEFSKKVYGSRIKVDKELVDATEKLKVGDHSGDTQAFWIEF